MAGRGRTGHVATGAVLAAALTLGTTAGCTTATTAGPRPARSATAPVIPSASRPVSAPTQRPVGTTAPTQTSMTVPPARATFHVDSALRTIDYLAGRIGMREASSAHFRTAARWVSSRFQRLGYDVQRQPVPVPAGVSWGIDVPAGRTWNIVAAPPQLRLTRPHLLVGAHLDTVPQAPGAEDNASGVAVVLELARLTAAQGSRLPVVFVAFGGEEPRGIGDNMHHFGSTAMVERMPTAQRRAVAGMVALDRVSVGTSVPVCTGGLGPSSVQRALLRTARRDGIPAQACVNALSDHWSFEKAGVAAARVGGTPYAAYHSAADVPSVVNRAQLERSGQLLWDWLRR